MLISAVFIFITGMSLSAENRTINLKQAIDLSLKNNPDLLQSQKDVEIAEAILGQSYADLFMPQVNATGGFSYTDPNSLGRSFQQIKINGETIVITNAYPDNYSTGISVSKTLFQGFYYWNTKEIQQKNLELAKSRYRDTQNAVRLNVTTNFYSVLLERENLELVLLSDRNLSNRLDYVEKYYKKGLTNELVYLQAKFSFKSNRPVVLKAGNDYDSARWNLCALIGISNPNEIEFMGDYYQLTNVDIGDEKESLMAGRAVSNDLTLITTEISIAQARLTRAITEFSKYPTLTGSLNFSDNYKINNAMINTRTWQPSWQAGLNLNFPVEEWLPVSKTAYTATQNDRNLEKLELSRGQRIDTVNMQFDAGLRQLNELKAGIESQGENENLAKRTFELAKDQFDRGLAIVMDLNDYELSYRQAEFSYWQAVYNYAMAVMRLKYMMGE
jgi:outer membrane protein